MKIKLKYFHFFIFLLLFSFNSYAQDNTIKGYTIEGEDVIFIFNINDYPNIKNNGDTVDNVYVSGEFNNWAKDQWKMNKVNDSLYKLRKNLSLFTSDFDWEFKFIVNSEHWAEPSSDFENIVDARDYKGHRLMVYNLKLYSAFATDYGNVSFKLKGYKDAESVILSGTFNRWDESGFVMKPTEDGWEVTLQLRPDIYQYKFIIDNHHWIEDPHNPSKIENEFGGFNSVIDVQKNIEFILCDFQDAETVILSGDFNDWSEDNYKMEKINDCWTYSIRLSGGKYHYKFIVDGEWITDPYNTVKEYDGKGHINSVCMVK
ncbi:hypothetical protein [Winogradskyella luteola]|uniref:AMP-activated protein kinase glycogen-binding domain-containing protein n=1 Tax=Winogradskyella luteola TaxID=2828330 RepID=A0A9X1JLR5_9FLAO|nr:hypothetical protein [Winogradskyella luteola]MBV7267625.1 hypothetical protein [Winogradskyella luteola]